MNELIKIEINDRQEPFVSGRTLHEYLEVETPYRKWFPRMTDYGFENKVDYTADIFVHPQNLQETTDHHITIDMAKELCMIQRTEKGKEARKYFITVEKELNNPERLMARALRIADETINNLKTKIKFDEPLTNFGRAIATNADCILLGDYAKMIYNTEGIKIGRNRLFKWMRNNGYLDKKNTPYQRYVEQGLFEVEPRVVKTVKGDLQMHTTKITGKGQMYFLDKIKTFT